jgi:hypothetical protein
VGGAKSTLGSSTVQGPAGEFVVSGPATCPNGNPGVEITLVPGTGGQVFRFNSTGDLLFERDISFTATACSDSSTIIVFGGGTGEFRGALDGSPVRKGPSYILVVLRRCCSSS